ncbi:MAG: hypothetical protein ACT4P7_17515 [Gemmatimonadaceae bacterium]
MSNTPVPRSGTPLASSVIREAHTSPAAPTVKDGDLSVPMELNEFMTQLGVVMRLPTRSVATIPEPAAVTSSRRRTRPLLPIAAAVTVLVYAAMQLRPAPSAIVPPEITGTWETTDPRYAGRHLVLSDRGVLHVVGSAPNGDVELVRAVATRRVFDTLAVVLTYGSSTPPGELAMAYVRQPREQLILRNPSGVAWSRTAAVVVGARAPSSPSLATDPSRR